MLPLLRTRAGGAGRRFLSSSSSSSFSSSFRTSLSSSTSSKSHFFRSASFRFSSSSSSFRSPFSAHNLSRLASQLGRRAGSLTSRVVISAKQTFSSSSSSSGGGGPVAWYGRMLAEHPMVTKALSSALIVLGGDLGCQLFIEDSGQLDAPRLMRMFFLGGALVAPVLHVWYGALFRWFPQPTWRATITRVALDQALFAPAFCGVFFTAIFALEGRLDALEDHLRANFTDAVKVNWLIWIPAQLINFKFVPPQLQVLFANFVALFWNSYLSWSGHKEQHLEDAKEPETGQQEPPIEGGAQ